MSPIHHSREDGKKERRPEPVSGESIEPRSGEGFGEAGNDARKRRVRNVVGIPMPGGFNIFI